MSRIKRMLAWALVALVVLLLSGLLLAERMTPRATGAPSHALPVLAAQTALDREIAPLVAKHGGRTGAILVPDGVDAFAARALSARRAGRSLDLMYYIWHDDLTGRLLGREAWQAAERGVRVRILLDDINAGGKDLSLLALDAHPNVEVRLYNPFRNRDGIGRLKEMAQRFFSLNHRMHNKAWIADGRMAVVGGRNIGTEYFAASHESNFHDLDLVLFGPAVRQASAIFDDYWNSAAAVPVAALNDAPPAGRLRALAQEVRAEAESEAARTYLARVEASPNVRAYAARTLEPIWSDDVEIVSDPPLKQAAKDGAVLARRIAADLDGARRKALVISPYFVPGDAGADALVGLARRGVFTAVVTNSLAANDVAAVHGGYSRYRLPLLDGGVRLYEIRAQAGGGGDARAGVDGIGDRGPVRVAGVPGGGSSSSSDSIDNLGSGSGGDSGSSSDGISNSRLGSSSGGGSIVGSDAGLRNGSRSNTDDRPGSSSDGRSGIGSGGPSGDSDRSSGGTSGGGSGHGSGGGLDSGSRNNPGDRSGSRSDSNSGSGSAGSSGDSGRSSSGTSSSDLVGGSVGASGSSSPGGSLGASSSGSSGGFGSGSGGGSMAGSSSGASLHTKAYVVDDARGFIGSFNMDPRSANLNTEMGVFFDDPAIAAALRAEYLHLAGPKLSYWVYRNGAGDLRWLDRAATPPHVLTREPDADLLRRAQAALFRWLPVESQL